MENIDEIKVSIIKKFEEMLNDSILSLQDDGKFSSTEIGKEIGKFINLKMKDIRKPRGGGAGGRKKKSDDEEEKSDENLSAKEKNAIRVRLYRERQKELLGKEQFNKKEAEARKLRHHLQKETLAKQTAVVKGSNMVDEIISSILDSIPDE